ncbi:TetR/AcrR family transcriptional regulator [Paenibacillus sp. P26]|nr:TetR/AcrR family transcriptional regulator [Paenibacillus sp. P26]
MERSLSARERLIQATSNLIELQGYHATGLNQIIKEGGAPKGSLYYYFPNGKEELVAESVVAMVWR